MDKLGRLMLPDLQQTVDPLRLAKAGTSIAGQYDIRKMERLCPVLYQSSGNVSFTLEFGRDEENALYCITGQVETRIIAVCQRCLEGVELPIKCCICLGIIKNRDEAELLPSGFDPIMPSEGKISLLELVEDELLLALPIAPMHKEEDCSATRFINSQTTEKSNSPFAELNKLKKSIRG